MLAALVAWRSFASDKQRKREVGQRIMLKLLKSLLDRAFAKWRHVVEQEGIMRTRVSGGGGGGGGGGGQYRGLPTVLWELEEALRQVRSEMSQMRQEVAANVPAQEGEEGVEGWRGGGGGGGEGGGGEVRGRGIFSGLQYTAASERLLQLVDTLVIY